MTLKDPANGRVYPQFNALVPSNRQSAVYPSSPSWTDSQRTKSTMNVIGPSNARFPHIKDLQGKANASVRNIDPRMPVCQPQGGLSIFPGYKCIALSHCLYKSASLPVEPCAAIYRPGRDGCQLQATRQGICRISR